MSIPAEAGKLTALESLEELKRAFAGEALRDPRYVYLGDAAHEALLEALMLIYPPGQLKRMAAPYSGQKPTGLLKVAGLTVRRHNLPYMVLVTREEMW